MNLSDVLDVLSDGSMLKVSAVGSFLDPKTDVKSCYIGLVSDFKKLPDDIICAFVVEICVFDDMFDILVDPQHSEGYNLRSFSLAEALTVLSSGYYCSVNSGLVGGDSVYLLRCLSPDYLDHTVAGMLVDDDRSIEITLIDK